MALLQIRSTPIIPASLAMLRFNRLTRGIIPKFSRQLVLYNNDETNLIVHLERQPLANQDADVCKNILFLPIGSTVAG